MPPFSIPPEIFNQLRRDLRAQSGIPSYDPTDPAIPNPQLYEPCISQVDPSLPYLRCRNCQGRLLRGVNSVFCVFCGKERLGNVMPDPLNFRDSKGYAWLLEVLGLDGSENVVPISREDEPYKEKDRVKDEIRLCDLLSLEIKWSVPAEKPATSVGLDSAQPKSSLNLGGVDLDNFFGEGADDIGSTKSEKKSGADGGCQAFESKITQAPINLSLFGNVPLPSTTVNSTDIENRNPMSAWEAEFRSADSDTAQKASPAPDPFAGSSVDISAHIDAMFESGNERKRIDAKPSSSDMDDWFDDDLRSNSNIGFNGQPSHDAGHSGVPEGPSKSTTDYTWIEDIQWLSNAAGASKSDRTDEDDVWNDFTSSTNAVENNVWKHADGVATSKPTPPEDFLGSTNDLMVHFGFSRQDLFPGASSITMKPVNSSSVQTEASALDRDIKMDTKEGSEETVKPEGTNATSRESDKLQMLISQMHDLSFMLDSNLSIPSMSGKTSVPEK